VSRSRQFVHGNAHLPDQLAQLSPLGWRLRGLEPASPAAIKPHISMGDLDKIDIRVATIERIENVPRSDKLVKLTVDFGDHKRSILVGMRQERADPKTEIEGRQALFVVNLSRAKWPAKSRKECCLTLAILTASHPCSRCQSDQCQTDRAAGR
jgi:tRNA-binding protein